MVKIRGLVAFQKRVWEEMARGVSPQALEPFRRSISNAVKAVRELCEEHGLTPDELPPPSRNAYRFLASINLDAINVSSPGRPALPRAVGLRNVVSVVNRFSSRMWAFLDRLLKDPGMSASFREELAASARKVETLCAELDSDPSMLDGRTRLGYCWLRFLSQEEHFYDHLQALVRVRGAAARSSPGKRHEVHFLAMSSTWRMDCTRGVVRHRFHEGFIIADDPFWDTLFQDLACGRLNAFRRSLSFFSSQEPFQVVCCEIESFGEPPSWQTQGRHHNLEASFARVNGEYFSGKMERPTLTWSSRLTTRMFGYYRFATDRLTVSQTLDDPTVPVFVLDFVMYHELLHKKLGHSDAIASRRRYHTPEFQALERRFKYYHEASTFLRHLSERLAGRG